MLSNGSSSGFARFELCREAVPESRPLQADRTLPSVLLQRRIALFLHRWCVLRSEPASASNHPHWTAHGSGPPEARRKKEVMDDDRPANVGFVAGGDNGDDGVAELLLLPPPPPRTGGDDDGDEIMAAAVEADVVIEEANGPGPGRAAPEPPQVLGGLREAVQRLQDASDRGPIDDINVSWRAEATIADDINFFHTLASLLGRREEEEEEEEGGGCRRVRRITLEVDWRWFSRYDVSTLIRTGLPAHPTIERIKVSICHLPATDMANLRAFLPTPGQDAASTSTAGRDFGIAARRCKPT